MKPIKYNELMRLFRQVETKLRRIQRDKTVNPALVASLRLFLIGTGKLLVHFRSIIPPNTRSSVTFQALSLKDWEDMGDINPRILKPILHRRRYTNLSKVYKVVYNLDKNLEPEFHSIFFIMTTILVIEVYTILMFTSTALMDPSFLRGSAAKSAARSILAFRRVANVPLSWYDQVKSNPDNPEIHNIVNTAIENMRPFLGKNLRSLATFNKKLVQ